MNAEPSIPFQASPIAADHGATLTDRPTRRGQCGMDIKKPRFPGAGASGGGGFCEDLIDPALIGSQCCELVVADDQIVPVVVLQV